MFARRIKVVAAILAGVVVIAWLRSGSVAARGVAQLHPDQEDVDPDGALYTPSTQSFTRGHHFLDRMDRVEIHSDAEGLARLELRDPEGEHSFAIVNVPLDQLVPRLHYRAASPPDAFDAFNLRMAEYARNGLSVAVGERGDEAAHFETDLPDGAPWSLAADYAFIPNPKVKPVRVSVINNCLSPGLWELSASDRTGELHHSWFEFPRDYYEQLLAETSGVPLEFARDAVQWDTSSCPPAFDRLREHVQSYAPVDAQLAPEGRMGFSSQGSRRKLARGFAMVGADADELRAPERRGELTQESVYLVDFVAPGKYTRDERRRFDLRFLAQPAAAEVQRVRPLTHYGAPEEEPAWEPDYIELALPLGDGYSLVLGNLPLCLLVPQEDFVISGFGVGVLAASGFAERRAMLLADGPAPSFAYLMRGGEVLNSHELGVEQVFIRTHSRAAEPFWEITLTSFERIVDLVRYRVLVPPALGQELRDIADTYVSPLYLTYRDDNLR